MTLAAHRDLEAMLSRVRDYSNHVINRLGSKDGDGNAAELETPIRSSRLPMRIIDEQLTIEGWQIAEQ
jgi:hypothetical protein